MGNAKHKPQLTAEARTTRQEPLNVGVKRPVWSFSGADRNGNWPWGTFDAATSHLILQKLCEFEKYTWTELQQTGDHHPIDLDKICTDAQHRLNDLRLADKINSLFSFSLQGKPRLWGYRTDEGIYKVLWWDPEHTVYPYMKKHT